MNSRDLGDASALPLSMTTSSSVCSEYVKSPPVVIAAKKLYAIASDSKQLVSSVEAVRLVSPKAQALQPVAPAKLYFPGRQETQYSSSCSK